MSEVGSVVPPGRGDGRSGAAKELLSLTRITLEVVSERKKRHCPRRKRSCREREEKWRRGEMETFARTCLKGT